MPRQSLTLSIEMVAAQCRVSQSTVRKWLDCGRLRCLGQHDGRQIEPNELSRFLREHGMSPPDVDRANAEAPISREGSPHA